MDPNRKDAAASDSKRLLTWSKTKTWGFRIAEFGASQAAIQVLTALSGILIIRSLPKPDYVLFAIVNSMQSACLLLADVGIGIGFMSIGGRVFGDRHRFGELLNTAVSLRKRFAVVSLAVCLPLAAWMLVRSGANLLTTMALSLALAASVLPLLTAAVLSDALILHSDYRKIQTLKLGSACARLLTLTAMALSRMTALLVVSITVAVNHAQIVFLRPWAKRVADPVAPPNAQDRRELLRLSLRSLPNAIFFCFQGQITLLILSYFGNPSGIADITALGRIAMIFAVSSAVFGGLLAPRFTRCHDPVRMRRIYLLLIGGSSAILLLLATLAWVYSAPFLWLLGPKYANLGDSCGLVVAAGCASQIGALIWALNASKAWIRFQAPGYIPVVITAQVIAASCLNLRVFHDVLIFNLAMAVAPIPLFLLDSVSGFRNQRLLPHSTTP